MGWLDEHYLEFENRFRGSEQEIVERMSFYTRSFVDAGFNFEGKRVLDLGSGRGEWLSIVSALGALGFGVDLNASMVGKSTEKGLTIFQDDALGFLSKSKEKFDFITAFHIVEHLDFEDWVELINLSHEKLNNGGVLLIETPNPRNIIVGTSNFYLDPSHIRPIPSMLMEFVAKQVGFEHVVTFGNNSSTQIASLRGSIENTSPDYVCVALKGITPPPGLWEALTANDVDFLEAVDKYEMMKLDLLADSHLKLNSELRSAIEKMDHDHRESMDSILSELKSAIEKMDHDHRESMDSILSELKSIRSSWSWRLTKPMRQVGSIFRHR